MSLCHGRADVFSTSTVAELNTPAFFSQVAWLGEEMGLV